MTKSQRLDSGSFFLAVIKSYSNTDPCPYNLFVPLIGLDKIINICKRKQILNIVLISFHEYQSKSYYYKIMSIFSVEKHTYLLTYINPNELYFTYIFYYGMFLVTNCKGKTVLIKYLYIYIY